ncbi:hypothetical protein C1H46_003027 [Malus baccata]|uniref:Uncharacterized protein n=1 Tax=Malus baccata TaxID=106549 RepID=A0A540NKX8_MALBA|nr:hypothetical protein C1H46_003027 [Malus baccata]
MRLGNNCHDCHPLAWRPFAFFWRMPQLPSWENLFPLPNLGKASVFVHNDNCVLTVERHVTMVNTNIVYTMNVEHMKQRFLMGRVFGKPESTEGCDVNALDANWFMAYKVFTDEPNMLLEGFNDPNLILVDLDYDLIICFPQPPKVGTNGAHFKVGPEDSECTVSWVLRKRRRENDGDGEDENEGEGEGTGLGLGGGHGLGV